jgi:hypothetical protein
MVTWFGQIRQKSENNLQEKKGKKKTSSFGI